MIDNEQRIAFLRKIHLFQGMTDEELTTLAGQFDEANYQTHTRLFEQDSQADSFFLIYTGKVKLLQKTGREERPVASLINGDYFGEEVLIKDRQRSVAALCENDVTLLTLSREKFKECIKQFPKFRSNLKISSASRLWAQKARLKWVRPDEFVYFLARRHPVVFLRSLLGPLILLIVSAILFVAFLAKLSFPLVFLCGVAVLGVLLWTIWGWIDWRNDFCIVSNQRVVWLEKVIAIYENRQETPLNMVLNVGVETSLYGRVLDYGNVIVRTYVGQITLSNIYHPNQAAAIIEEFWDRAKDVSHAEEVEAMKKALKTKLGMGPQEGSDESQDRPISPIPSPYRPGILQMLGSNIFKLRIEEKGTITYRKHLFVLMKKTAWPGFLLIGMIGLIVSRIAILAMSNDISIIGVSANGINFDTILLAFLLLLIPLILWWSYQYVDWSNDIFQVTHDQILDIDRKPFGMEDRRAAQLENILSTEYKRLGLFGYIFNYGTVYITVGGTQLAFEDVWDPASVQQDIDQRRMAIISQKKLAETTAERERMAEWLATYHRSADQFQASSDQDPSKPR